jgi:osmotically-inducible protein OsmY
MTPVVETQPKNPAAVAAERLFAQCPYPSLRDLQCEVADGRLVLHGRVPSYFLKAVAQTMAGRIAGVREIVNRLEVDAVPAARA